MARESSRRRARPGPRSRAVCCVTGCRALTGAIESVSASRRAPSAIGRRRRQLKGHLRLGARRHPRRAAARRLDVAEGRSRRDLDAYHGRARALDHVLACRCQPPRPGEGRERLRAAHPPAATRHRPEYVDRAFLAGGFANAIDIPNAIAIGFIAPVPIERSSASATRRCAARRCCSSPAAIARPSTCSSPASSTSSSSRSPTSSTCSSTAASSLPSPPDVTPPAIDASALACRRWARAPADHPRSG